VARVALNLGEDPPGRVVGMTLRRSLAQLNVILPGRGALAGEVGCVGIAVGPEASVRVSMLEGVSHNGYMAPATMWSS
jgi:hypothetical protein